MSLVIPDPIPVKASQGEKRVHTLLRTLPDSCLAYYEPYIDNRRPDFIVIIPDLGILVIEVKGYYPASIAGASDAEVIYEWNNREKRDQHPLAQAREYMWRLFHICEKNTYFSYLINPDGHYKNRLIFPFAHIVVLSNCTRKSLTSHELGDLTQVFRPEHTLYRDNLLEMEKMSPLQLRDTLKGFFDPCWTIPPMTEAQIKILRSIIHPEFIIKPVPKEDHYTFEEAADHLAILDHRQETNAARIKEGHRIIYGVVGSGKTVILIARAKILHDQREDTRILVLCYNVSLSLFLQNSFRDYPKIECTHFHEWARRCGIVQKIEYVGGQAIYESDEALGTRLVAKLEQDTSIRYDAIFIDETQDFDPTWIRSALQALKDPVNGDLFIVCDGNQGIYSRKNASWSSLGINAMGRTYSSKLDLDKNYRNTKEILSLAYHLVNDQKKDDTNLLGAIPVTPDCAIRSGPRPTLKIVQNHAAEWDEIIRFFSDPTQVVADRVKKTDGIGILYPRIYSRERAAFHEKIHELNAVLTRNNLPPALWVNEHPKARERLKIPGIKVMTIHSSKGLQFEQVIMIYLDTLTMHESVPGLNDRLCYIGMTRSEKYLTLIASGYTPQLTRLMQTGTIDQV